MKLIGKAGNDGNTARGLPCGLRTTGRSNGAVQLVLSRELELSLRFPADPWTQSVTGQRLIAVGCRFESCRHHQLVHYWSRFLRSSQILRCFLRSCGE
jgi:hypothetical protein